MQGIQSLMPGQAQQAPLPGMMPKPGAATPPAVVAGLEMLPSQQLLQIYSQKPSLQVLAALDKAYKREELGQSMRGQQAMQQAAQPGTVADQLVSQIANRGIAQFSGGGAVAFNKGGDPEEERLRQQIREMFGSAASPLNILGPRAGQARERAQDIMRMLPSMDKEQMRNILGMTQRAVDPNAYQEFGPGERQESRAPFEADMARLMSPYQGTGRNLPNVLARPSPAPTADLRRQTSAAPAPSASPSGQRQAAAPTPLQGVQSVTDLDQAKAAELAVIQGRQAVDPTVLAARRAEREGAEGIAAGRQTRSQAQLTEAQRLRDEALQRSQGNIFSDPEALLRIASGIDTRKGRGIGSLAGGVADIMGQRRSEAAAARKDFQTAQNAYNQEMNALDTLRQLQRERDTAIAAGDVTAARAIQDQITSINRFYQKAKEDRQTAERNYQLDVLKTQATQDQARAAVISANRPTEFQQKMDLFRKDPAAFEKMYGAKEKSSYDTINDNAQKKFSDWATSPKGMTASAEDRNAMWQEILNREIDTAKRFGVKTPDGAPAAAPAGGPITPKSQAEFNALPKGARYINPADGKEYTKN